MTAPTPTLPGDLDTGLRRLHLGAMRRVAPELLVTAKTQRWAPEELSRVHKLYRGASEMSGV